MGIAKTGSGNLQISSSSDVQVESVTSMSIGGTLTMDNNIISAPDVRIRDWDTGDGNDVSDSLTVTKNGLAGRITWECTNTGNREFDTSETKDLTVTNNVVVSNDMIIAWIARQNTNNM